jgi:hypothetical protein
MSGAGPHPEGLEIEAGLAVLVVLEHDTAHEGAGKMPALLNSAIHIPHSAFAEGDIT